MTASAELTSRPMPRVLFLDHVGVLGGAELGLVDFCRPFAGSSEAVLLADGPLRAALEEVGLRVTILPAPDAVTCVRRESGRSGAVKAVPGVLGLALKLSRKARCFDVIWANSQKAFIIGSIVARLSGTPLVWHLHDILSADHFSPFNRRLAVGLANRCAATVVCVSESVRRSFLDSGGAPELTQVVYNGIDRSPFDQLSDDEIAALRSQLGLDGHVTVGVFGRLTAWKGQHVLIHAIAQLPGVHALLVGDALFNETDYVTRLRSEAQRRGVAGRVHFLGFRRDVPVLMRMVDVIAHTSTAPEPFGRVLVEGMLAGKPVIGARGGGASEILTHEVDGLLAAPGDPDALAGAIRRVLSDADLAASLARNGAQTAVERFSVHAMCRDVVRIARQVSGITPREPSRAARPFEEVA